MILEKEYIMQCPMLKTDVPWDDAIVVSVGKLRKLWDFQSELRSSMCEKRLENIVLRSPLSLVKTAQFTQFLCQVWHHTGKLLNFTVRI